MLASRCVQRDVEAGELRGTPVHGRWFVGRSDPHFIHSTSAHRRLSTTSANAGIIGFMLSGEALFNPYDGNGEDTPAMSDNVSYLAIADGQVALTHIERAIPALIVLDLMLRGLDGMSFCRAVRRSSDVPIIMVTAPAPKDSGRGTRIREHRVGLWCRIPLRRAAP